ncbi:MAG: DUF5916 domain-containing protein [Vicinamibacterales bacterium]
MLLTFRRSSLALLVLTFAALPAAAQSPTAPPNDGRKRMAATALTGAITLDGRLDEAAWASAQPATGFVQSEPVEGQPASETTEVRILFDHDNLYIGATCHDADAKAIVINEIRKDFASGEQDTFEVLLDTFADRRNGFIFATNAEGAKADTQVANEGREVNTNWDAVWWVQTSVTDDGWSAEFRIPFKTLRFESGEGHVWGINFARRIRRKNEVTYWSPVSRAYALTRVSADGDLTGLPNMSQGRNLRVKPFVLAGGVRPAGATEFDRDTSAGLDVKVGVTPSLTLDFTLNPDFAQAEADEQQVNLTQFSLFFPEKREFFLENSGIFYFGDIPRNQRSANRFRPPEEDLLLFFSRRVGLDDSGNQIPLHGGARLTGRAGGFGVGAMTVQSKESDGRPGSNFTVLRLRRDLFKNSDIGAILTSRQSARNGHDYNRVGGVDANFRFFRNFSINSFFAKSATPGAKGDQDTARMSVGWEDSNKRLGYSFLTIGDGFKDDLGFVRRTGVRRQFFDSAFHFRPQWWRSHGIRDLEPHARRFLYKDPAGTLVSSTIHAGNQWTWNTGTTFEVAVEPRSEAITAPFQLRKDVRAILPGRYDWTQTLVVLETDHSRKLSGSFRGTFGGFWDGTQRSIQTAATFRPTYRLLFDLGLQVNDITLETPAADFTTTLVNLRAGYAFSTRMFLDSLLQYRNDVHQFSANVRLQLIHRPLSDFFIVYNEQQFTDVNQPAGRGVVVKYTHMLAF